MKKVDPAYQQVNESEFPVTEISGGTVKTLVGEGSPLQLMTPVSYLDVQLEQGASFSEALPAEFRGFIYLVDGSVNSDRQQLNAGTAYFLEQGERLMLEAVEKCRFMLCFGAPHGEPIIQHGPFVD